MQIWHIIKIFDFYKTIPDKLYNPSISGIIMTIISLIFIIIAFKI